MGWEIMAEVSESAALPVAMHNGVRYICVVMHNGVRYICAIYMCDIYVWYTCVIYMGYICVAITSRT